MTGKRERIQIETSSPSLAVVVTDDGSRTLRCLETGVTWHSESGALAESQLVFLENSGIADRLVRGQPTRVLEIGFGTGLNFWITASVAIRHGVALEYFSVDPQLPDSKVVSDLQHGSLESCQPAFDCFHQSVFPQTADSRLQIEVVKSGIRLVIQRTGFAPEGFLALPLFQAVYHDPFDPDTAPELWTETVFRALWRMLVPGGRLVTYCVKSGIQRRLKSAGFLVSKTRGPVGGKREVLVATRPE